MRWPAARHWDNPEAFKPERFLGNYPRDAFLPFSGGPHGCIGRGFVLGLYLEYIPYQLTKALFLQICGNGGDRGAHCDSVQVQG